VTYRTTPHGNTALSYFRLKWREILQFPAARHEQRNAHKSLTHDIAVLSVSDSLSEWIIYLPVPSTH